MLCTDCDHVKYSRSDDQLSLKWAWSRSRDQIGNFKPYEISSERPKPGSSNFVCLQAIPIVTLRTTDSPLKRSWPGLRDPIQNITPLLNFCAMDKDRFVKFCTCIGPSSACLLMTHCPVTGRSDGHATFSFCWKISVNILTTVQDTHILTMVN